MNQNETMRNTQTEITMIPVANCDSHPRFIPSDRAFTRIDADWLKNKCACPSGWDWFSLTFPEGCTYLELRAELATQGKIEWESWATSAIGGDSATAGHRGTATAGHRGIVTAGDGGTATAGDSGTATAGYGGVATAGHRGTATAGYRGTATAGHRGTATAGHRGIVTAGDGGTATAGYGGTATAGDGGIIRILEWCDKQSRYRAITGIIGENGIKPNIPYICEDGKLTPKKP